jgi:hypothetical protein
MLASGVPLLGGGSDIKVLRASFRHPFALQRDRSRKSTRIIAAHPQCLPSGWAAVMFLFELR